MDVTINDWLVLIVSGPVIGQINSCFWLIIAGLRIGLLLNLS